MNDILERAEVLRELAVAVRTKQIISLIRSFDIEILKDESLTINEKLHKAEALEEVISRISKLEESDGSDTKD